MESNLQIKIRIWIDVTALWGNSEILREIWVEVLVPLEVGFDISKIGKL